MAEVPTDARRRQLGGHIDHGGLHWMLNLRQRLFGDLCHERHSRETLAELNSRPAIDDLALEEELAWSTDSLRN